MVAKLKSGSLTDEGHEEVERLISTEAFRFQLDKVGRVCFPEEMLEGISVEKEAAWVGRIDKCELWNPALLETRNSKGRQMAQAALKNLNL